MALLTDGAKRVIMEDIQGVLKCLRVKGFIITMDTAHTALEIDIKMNPADIGTVMDWPWGAGYMVAENEGLYLHYIAGDFDIVQGAGLARLLYVAGQQDEDTETVYQRYLNSIKVEH